MRASFMGIWVPSVCSCCSRWRAARRPERCASTCSDISSGRRLGADRSGDRARTIDRIFRTQFVDEAEVESADRRQPAARRSASRAGARVQTALRRGRTDPSRVPAGLGAAPRRLRCHRDGLRLGDYTKLAPAGRASRRGAAASSGSRTSSATSRSSSTSDTATRHGELRAAGRLQGLNDPGGAGHDRSGGVLLSHTATVQYHRRWRA